MLWMHCFMTDTRAENVVSDFHPGQVFWAASLQSPKFAWPFPEARSRSACREKHRAESVQRAKGASEMEAR